MSGVITEDDVRYMVIEATRRVGLAKWCAEHHVAERQVRQIIDGVSRPWDHLLLALGLRWAIVPIEAEEAA